MIIPSHDLVWELEALTRLFGKKYENDDEQEWNDNILNGEDDEYIEKFRWNGRPVGFYNKDR